MNSNDYPESEQEPRVLEPEQLTTNLKRPVPGAQLSGRTRAALLVLRVVVLAVSGMVVYTFVTQLT